MQLTNHAIEELEREKERLIHDYLGLQDQADALNEQIYHLCCDIAVLNKRIEAARNEELKKQRSRTQVPARSPQAGDGNGRQR